MGFCSCVQVTLMRGGGEGGGGGLFGLQYFELRQNLRYLRKIVFKNTSRIVLSKTF